MTRAADDIDPDLDPPSARPPDRRRRAMVLAAIATGGGLGSCARHLLETALPPDPGGVPWATFLINVTGCLALGALMVGVLEAWPPTRYVRPFWGVGFLGGYTTFSTYAVELRDLAAGGAWTTAAGYALASLAAGLTAAWAGTTATRTLLHHTKTRRPHPRNPHGEQDPRAGQNTRDGQDPRGEQGARGEQDPRGGQDLRGGQDPQGERRVGGGGAGGESGEGVRGRGV